jgi:hypothetical protein
MGRFDSINKVALKVLAAVRAAAERAASYCILRINRAIRYRAGYDHGFFSRSHDQQVQMNVVDSCRHGWDDRGYCHMTNNLRMLFGAEKAPYN